VSNKRIYALVAGIIAVTLGGLILWLLVDALDSILPVPSNIYMLALFVYLFALLLIIMAIMTAVNIIIGVAIIITACTPNCPPKVLTGLAIALAITSFMGSSNLIAMGFAIVAAVTKDNPNPNSSSPAADESDFDQAMCRLKQYHADEIITEKEYREKASELFRKYYVHR